MRQEKKISEISYNKETQGENLRTTIDIEIQQLAQELLKDQAGSICVMDIYTGEVIAMASSPTYDPNKFTHGISTKDWNEIIDKICNRFHCNRITVIPRKKSEVFSFIFFP